MSSCEGLFCSFGAWSLESFICIEEQFRQRGPLPSSLPFLLMQVADLPQVPGGGWLAVGIVCGFALGLIVGAVAMLLYVKRQVCMLLFAPLHPR